MGESGTPDWYARRARLRAAVFGPPGSQDAQDDQGAQDPWTHQPVVAASVTTGVLAEVRPDAVVIEGSRGTEYFTLGTQTVTWIGAHASASVLRPGDQVVIRHRSPDGNSFGHRLAERIWARVGRVAGTIVEERRGELVVDTHAVGTHGRQRQRVLIATAAARQIQVRFPRLAPGYLLDVIGTRHRDYLLAVLPATSQPPYRAGHFPRPPTVSDPVTMPVNGSAVWHEPAEGEPADLLGVGYPAIDQDSGRAYLGCARLPYLSLGAAVRIRNECTGLSAMLPVTSEGAVARHFCDRCLNCGTSPKGRVADLTIAAFVALGGNLEEGCFNATLMTLPV